MVFPHPALIDEIKSSNGTEARRKLKSMLGGIVPLRGYEPFACDLRTFAWSSEISDRSWWWALHQLPFLELAAGVQYASEQDWRETAEFVKAALRQWVDHNPSPECCSPLAWHDHASAFRARNLYRWIAKCLVNGHAQSEVAFEVGLLREHLDWLSQDANYTKNTNHGFDQSLFMLQAVVGLRGVDTNGEVRELARKRLESEVRFAFTSQGVHKENSPAYHFFMIKRVHELLLYLDRYELTLGGVDLRQIVVEGRCFLEAIANSRYQLPLIGDSEQTERQRQAVRRFLSIPSGNGESAEGPVRDFSSSGYFIWKGEDQSGKPCHLVAKCCHDSDYHRHDDDGAIYLEYDHKDIFVDGGRYGYNGADFNRRYVRSAYAHSVFRPLLVGDISRKRAKVRQKPTMQYCEGALLMDSYRYDGVDITRRVEVSDRGGALSVGVQEHARFLGSPLQMVSSFLLADPGAEVELQSGACRVFLFGRTIVLHFDLSRVPGVKVLLHRGRSVGIEETAIISRKAGEYEAAARLDLVWESASTHRASVFDYSFSVRRAD